MNLGAGRRPGRGFGRGRGARGADFGGSRGRRFDFHSTGFPGGMRSGGYRGPYGYPVTSAAPSADWEKQTLRRRAEALQSELNAIQYRLSELEKNTESGTD